MRKRNKLVYGVGINDADYSVQKHENVGGKQRLLWICPFYQRWCGMFQRCYSVKYHIKFPTYLDCSVVPEWHYFMAFRAWMETQDWEGNELDKDVLIRGNKVYSPETCVFVSKAVNYFFNENLNKSRTCPLGVHFRKGWGKYTAACKDVRSGKIKYIGHFDNPQEAHQAWLAFKLKQAYNLAAEQTDQRVAKALIDRYENYETF